MTNQIIYPYKSAYVPNRKDRAIKDAAVKVARGRKTNKKLAKVIKDGPNVKALEELGKQVKLLRLEKFGSIQRQTQFMKIGFATPFPVTKTTPWCFCFNQFHCDPSSVSTALFQGSVSAVAPKIPLLNTVNTFQKQDFTTDIDDEFDWNAQRNNNITVSLIEYLPVWAKVTIHITGQLLQTDPIIKYRFDLFRLKNMPVKSLQKSWSLPQECGAYWHMANNDDPLVYNKFSKSYHDLIMTKWLTIVPPNQYSSIQKLTQMVEIPYSFGNTREGLKCNIAPLPTGQTMFSNIPEEEQMWVLISSNATTPPGLDITITRNLVWRDKHQNAGPDP